MKKGISPLIEALLLIVMSISLSVVIIGWLPAISSERAVAIKNITSEQLTCQFGHMFIKSATYNCSKSCAAGTSHTTTVNLVNSGKIPLSVGTIYIQNTTGFVYALDLNQTISLDPAATVLLTNISTDSCAGINRTIEKIIVNSINCPNTGFDSLRGSDINFASC